MRAPALYTAAGSLLLTTLAAAPAGGSTTVLPGAAVVGGASVAGVRAAESGFTFGACAEAAVLPGVLR
ncbi:alpha/beta hydrolase, partial [Streptomyces sp. NPDC096080]